MAASRMLVAVGMLAAAGSVMAQSSITGRNTGTAAQYKGSKSSSSSTNTQECDACYVNGNKAKLSSMTLRYVATTAGGNNNAQGTMGDKWGYSGSNFPASATITASDKKNQVLGTFQVSTNGVFTVDPAKFESITYFNFAGGQRVWIHTSCSQPLRVNDQFGSLVVVDTTNDAGGVGSTCQNEPCSAGSYGGVCPTPCVQSLSECQQCLMCGGPNRDKDDKPSVISFIYQSGRSTLSNTQEGKASVSGGPPVGSSALVNCPGVGFTQTVGAGVPFAVNNIRSGGNDFTCTISAGGQTQTIMLHVSCSKIIAVGDIYGSLEVSGFVLVNSKTMVSVSSADPGSCPTCELCCALGDMTVPGNVEIPAGSPGSNQDALNAWVASAKCVERETGNRLPVVHTLALLNGYDTCSVESRVTWTCVDDCGNHYSETRTFKVVDRTPPVVKVPPSDLTIQCDPTNPNYIPTDQVGAWLSQTWLAEDATQNAAPCVNYGSNIYVGQSPPATSPSYVAPPPPPYGSAPNTNSYGYTSGSTPPVNGGYTSYRMSGYGDGNPYYNQAPHADATSGRYESGSAIDCSYCSQAVFAPCCAGGVQYDNVCQALCYGQTVVVPGPCNTGVTSSYNPSAGNGAYSAGGSFDNCYCDGTINPVCSRNGIQYDSPCYAHCAGEFNFLLNPCAEVPYVTPVQTVYDPCGHCSSATQEPICGTNGVAYDSPCHAYCHGVTDFHYGSCTIFAPATSCGKVITYTHSEVTYGPCNTNQNYQSQYGYLGPVSDSRVCGTATFTATDACGNSASVPANIFVIDSAAPIISGGDDLSWMCDEDCAAYNIWEEDAQAILHAWIAGHGCLSAKDCSAVSWTVQGAPSSGSLCGTSGTVKFIATDAYGNTAFKNLNYEFPRKPAFTGADCYVCGQTVNGQRVKASLLQLTMRYDGPAGATIFANVEPQAPYTGVVSGQTVRFYAGSAFLLENAKSGKGGGSSSGGQKFPTNTEFNVNGAVTTLHTSCSQPITRGQVITFSNGATLTIVSFVTDSSTSEECEPDTCIPPTEYEAYQNQYGYGKGTPCPECAYPQVCGAPAPAYPQHPSVPVYTTPPPPPCYHSPTNLCDGSYSNKPTEVRLQLVAGAPVTTNPQDGYASYELISGSIATCPSTGTFTVVCTGGTVQTVPIGGLYIWTGYGTSGTGYNRFETTSVCQINGAGYKQKVTIHMDCVQRLYTGDQFGNLLIVGFKLPDGTSVDQTQCPAVPYTPPYVPPPTGVDYGSGYGGTISTASPVYAPPPTDPTTTTRSPTNSPTAYPTNQVYHNCNAYIQTVPDLAYYYEALQKTYVNVAIQSSGPYTVFCPTNAAINKFCNNNKQAYYDNNIAELTSVTLKHVFHGAYSPAQLYHGQTIQSLNGPCTVRRFGDYISIVNADGAVVCNVVGTGHETMNGWVYSVDNVVVPSTTYSAPPATTTVATTTYATTTRVATTTTTTQYGSCGNPTDACAHNGRLKSLTLKYVNSNACRHNQDAWGRGYCQQVASDPITYNLPECVRVRIVSSKFDAPDTITAEGWRFERCLGEEFTILGTEFGGFLGEDQIINVDTKETTSAKVKFATGCAAPIGIGDQFGSLVVTGYENSDGSVCTVADYQMPPGASTSAWKAPGVKSASSLSGTEIAAIVVGCIAAVALIAGTIFIKFNSKQNVIMSSHE